MSEFNKVGAEKCRTCNGTGQQTFHGSFFSRRGRCNFCGGHGTKEEELKWFDKSFDERGPFDPKKVKAA